MWDSSESPDQRLNTPKPSFTGITLKKWLKRVKKWTKSDERDSSSTQHPLLDALNV